MKEQSTTKGFAILSIAGLLVKILSILYVPFLIGIIDDAAYGVYSKTYEVFVFIYAVSNTGMQVAVCKIVAELRALGRERDAIRAFKLSRRMLLIIGSIFTVILFVFARPIAELSESPGVAYGLMVLSPTIVITSVLVSYRGYFNGRNSMDSLAISQVLEQIINVIVSLIFASILIKSSPELGSAGATVGTSVGALIACVYLITIFKRKRFIDEASKQPYTGRRISDKKIIKRILRYGLPITLSAGLANFGSMIDMFNVSSRLGILGYSEEYQNILYGLLGRYKTLVNVPLIFIISLGAALLPAISKSVVLKDKKELKRKVSFAFRMTYGITIPAAFGLAVLYDEIYRSFYNNSTGSMLMLYGSGVVVLMALNQIQSTMLQGVNKFSFLILSFGTGIIAKIIVNYVLVGTPSINIYGAIVGGFACYLLPVILNQMKLQKTIKIKIPLIRTAIKPTVSAIGMSISIMITRLLLTAILPSWFMERRIFMIILTFTYIMVGVITYAYMMIFTKGIRRKEIEDMSPRIYGKIPSFMRKHLK